MDEQRQQRANDGSQEALNLYTVYERMGHKLFLCVCVPLPHCANLCGQKWWVGSYSRLQIIPDFIGFSEYLGFMGCF